MNSAFWRGRANAEEVTFLKKVSKIVHMAHSIGGILMSRGRL